MAKENKKMACLKYIIQVRQSKQYILAGKLGIAPQHFTKYYHREKPIPEIYYKWLEKELKIDHSYWLDSRNRCLELTEERRMKLEEYFFEERRGNIVNIIEGEQQFYNDINLRRLFLDMAQSVYKNSEKKDLNAVMDNATAEITFYQNVIRLKNNARINDVIWECIIRALDMYSNQVEYSYISSYDFADILCDFILKENRRYKEENEEYMKDLKDLFEIDSDDVAEEEID